MTNDAKQKDKGAWGRAEGNRQRTEKHKSPLEEPGIDINPEQNNSPNWACALPKLFVHKIMVIILTKVMNTLSPWWNEEGCWPEPAMMDKIFENHSVCNINLCLFSQESSSGQNFLP